MKVELDVKDAAYIPASILKTNKLSPGAKLTYGWLMAKKAYEVVNLPKTSEISESLGVSRAQAWRYINELKSEGYLRWKL